MIVFKVMAYFVAFVSGGFYCYAVAVNEHDKYLRRRWQRLETKRSSR